MTIFRVVSINSVCRPCSVGICDGVSVDICDGVFVGFRIGEDVGLDVGSFGTCVGLEEGCTVGVLVGVVEG